MHWHSNTVMPPTVEVQTFVDCVSEGMLGKKSLNNERHSRESQHSLLPEQSENPLFLGCGELKRCKCIFSCVSGIVMVITMGRLSPKCSRKYAREEMREEEVKMKLIPSAKLHRRAGGAACCCRELSGLSDCGFWWINLQLMWSPRRTCRTDGAELLEPVHWSRPAKQTGGAHTQVGGQDGSTGVGIDAALGLPCIKANFRFTSIKKCFLKNSFVINLSVKYPSSFWPPYIPFSPPKRTWCY